MSALHLSEILMVSSNSGEYAEVAHADSNGNVYAQATRYPRIQNHQGNEWICFHPEQGGNGRIDFCIAGF